MSKKIDGAIISLIILIPVLVVTHHLLDVYFDLVFQYNQLAELYFNKTEVDRSIRAVYWFGFNVIDRVSQAIMLEVLLYIIFFSFFVLGALVYIYYIKPIRGDK